MVKSLKYSLDNPFLENFHSHQDDMLCKLNLRETSEFVKYFPMGKKNVSNNNSFTKTWVSEDLESIPNSELKAHLNFPKILYLFGTPPSIVENPLPRKYMMTMGRFSMRDFLQSGMMQRNG